MRFCIAPAQEAIEYEIKKVIRGFDDEKAIYQLEPSAEVDQAWVDLYERENISTFSPS